MEGNKERGEGGQDGKEEVRDMEVAQQEEEEEKKGSRRKRKGKGKMWW
jgi:hypothetical protein